METQTKVTKDLNTEIYTIEFENGKKITTKVSEQVFTDLKNVGVIFAETEEEEQKQLEGYLIRAASQFVEQGLDKEKSVNGKYDTAIGGMEDEF